MASSRASIPAANAAWREEAELQVHADNGCLRSHQVAQVDRSNRLNDSRLPNRQCRQRFKLVDNANPEPMLLELHFQQPARGCFRFQTSSTTSWDHMTMAEAPSPSRYRPQSRNLLRRHPPAVPSPRSGAAGGVAGVRSA